jgi:uncharacterized protein (TIGR02266 family)
MSERDQSDGDGADKRRHERKPVTLVVEYEGADDLVADFTENLSSGGTFVNTAHEFEVGTEIDLVLSFPGLLEPIKIAGLVRWAKGGDDETRGVGLEFTQYDTATQQKLDELMTRIEQRDPDVVSKLVKVLVVEDNPHVARLIRDGLRGSGRRTFGEDLAFNFRMASNGREALDLLRREPFDALIIDVYMPVLDGASVIEEVRADEVLKSMPIIAVSAGGERAREFAMGAGADFFLDKPMRLRQIIETMQQLLGLEVGKQG